jgi:hypothetical protein
VQVQIEAAQDKLINLEAKCKISAFQQSQAIRERKADRSPYDEGQVEESLKVVWGWPNIQ